MADDFGPPILTEAKEYWDAWQAATADVASPFQRYKLAGDGAPDWLRAALAKVNSEYKRLQVGEADFRSGASEWEPIPLDRPDAELDAATEAIANTIEELRSENGYGARHPEEKTYVLDKLRTGHKRLKEDAQISWMYLKEFVVEPLKILINRFGAAAVGVAASAAKEALKSWLRSKGIGFLDDIFG